MGARRRCTTEDRGLGDEEGEEAVNIHNTGERRGSPVSWERPEQGLERDQGVEVEEKGQEG